MQPDPRLIDPRLDADFDRDGYAIVPDLLDADEVERLAARRSSAGWCRSTRTSPVSTRGNISRWVSGSPWSMWMIGTAA
jgi:hypothetical protein